MHAFIQGSQNWREIRKIRIPLRILQFPARSHSERKQYAITDCIHSIIIWIYSLEERDLPLIYYVVINNYQIGVSQI